MSRPEKQFFFFTSGLIVILLVTVVLVFIGQTTAAVIVGNLATMIWLLGAILWITFKDSRQRWPEANAWQRFTNLITFQR